MSFFKQHKKLSIFLGIILAIFLLMCVMRAINKSRGSNDDASTSEDTTEVNEVKEDEEEESDETENSYLSSLGIGDDDNSGSRVVVPEKDDEEEQEEEEVQTEPTYPVKVNVFDHTSVPRRNMDGSSCKNYLKGVSLQDFGTYWGNPLTDEDFKGNRKILVGVEQDENDFERGDLQSVGWLHSNLGKLEPNDCVKFTNLHVIGSLSDTHVALLCSYDWYSAFGLNKTLVVFEDISDTLKVSDFSEGDIFSATVFVHNMKIKNNVNGQDVVVVQYALWE